MKKYWKVILLIGLFIVTVTYTYYVRPIVDDELFNYGFAKSILEGLVPYNDFNMIIPPLFSYLLALVLAILGKKLIVYHFVIALIIVFITWLSYKKIGKNALIIYFLLLVYPYTGYNMFCLFLYFILLSIQDKKYAGLIEPILISMMILTKQTLGLLMIPSLIYSKNKKKTISIYLISGCLFLLYLILNNNLFTFLDYCVWGMFDFTNKNTTSINFLFLIEIVILGGLVWATIKTKRKDIFFCFLFQIITFPIVDYVHFIISFIPVVYLGLSEFGKKRYAFLFTSTAVITFFLVLNVFIMLSNDNYLYLTHYKIDNFMKGRVTYRLTSDYVFHVKDFLDQYEDYRSYILGHFSYLIKLNNDLPINKYDLINNGNMGYHGSEKYLMEIDTYCKENQCIFIMNDSEATISKTIQTNREILSYVGSNYHKIYSSNVFSVYIN